jgi:hypothetical protein
MEKMISIPVKTFAGLAGVKPEEFIATLKGDEEQIPDNAWEKAAELVGDRITKIKKEKVDQYKRGQSEKGKDLDDVLKPLFEKHEIEPSDRVEDSVAALIEKVALAAKPGKSGEGKALTKEVILQSPFYKELTDGIKAKYADEITGLKTEYDTYKGEVQTKQSNSAVKRLVRKHLSDLNANDPTDENIEFFINGHGGINRFVPTEDKSDFYIKSQDGEIIEKHGSPISGKDFLQSKWEAYKGFNKVDPNKDGGTRRSGERGSGGVKHTFKDESDYRFRVDAANEAGQYKLASEMQTSWSKRDE